MSVMVLADFNEVNLDNSDFTKSNIAGSSYNKVKASFAIFKKAVMNRIKAIDTDFSGANFGETDLRLAIFNNSNLQGANLLRADLEGADFRKAKGLKCAQIQGAVNYRKAKFSEFLMTNCFENYIAIIKKTFPPDISDTPVRLNIGKVPREAFKRNNQGFNAFRTGNYKVAEEGFAAAEQIVPENATVKYNKVLALFKQKKYKQAAETLKVANALREKGKRK